MGNCAQGAVRPHNKTKIVGFLIPPFEDPGPQIECSATSDGGGSDNVMFYRNEIPSKPSGSYVDDILGGAWNNTLLEKEHGYIQWLFPSPQASLYNPHCQPLTQPEVDLFLSDECIRQRLERAIHLMFRFYGYDVVAVSDAGKCSLRRAARHRERMQNATLNPHNALRITRIIECIGRLGFAEYQVVLLTMLAEDIFEIKCLQGVHYKKAYFLHWIPAIQSKQNYDKLKAHLMAKYTFVQ
eukprot:PhM_4_TR5795/c0_g1_i2/m.26946